MHGIYFTLRPNLIPLREFLHVYKKCFKSCLHIKLHSHLFTGSHQKISCCCEIKLIWKRQVKYLTRKSKKRKKLHICVIFSAALRNIMQYSSRLCHHVQLKICLLLSSEMLYQSSPSFSFAGTSITLGLSMIRAVLKRLFHNCDHNMRDFLNQYLLPFSTIPIIHAWYPSTFWMS